MNAEKIHGENVYVNLDEVIETVYQCRRDEANDEWVKRWLLPLESLTKINVDKEQVMEETKVRIGEDVLLDIGTHSEWYISRISYDGKSVDVELLRKADKDSKWWLK